MRSWVKKLLGFLRLARVKEKPVPKDSYKPGVGTPPSAWRAGDPEGPKISVILTELEDFIIASGVPKKYWSAREICTLPKGQVFNGHRAVAIPPHELWPNILSTLELFIVLRERVGAPCALRGYRPPDYNEVVGGSPKSRHMWFAALDIYPPTGKNKRLGLEGARLYDEYPGVGFGAYGEPLPSNIHIDTGSRKRHWREAQYYIDLLGTTA